MQLPLDETGRKRNFGVVEFASAESCQARPCRPPRLHTPLPHPLLHPPVPHPLLHPPAAPPLLPPVDPTLTPICQAALRQLEGVEVQGQKIMVRTIVSSKLMARHTRLLAYSLRAY